MLIVLWLYKLQNIGLKKLVNKINFIIFKDKMYFKYKKDNPSLEKLKWAENNMEKKQNELIFLKPVEINQNIKDGILNFFNFLN